MNITSTIARPGEVQRTYQSQLYAAPQPQRTEPDSRRFDSVTIAASSSRLMELRGKIAQEVRTATSSGQVSALREQVQNGTYQPDAMEIARRMLLIPEAG